MQWITSREVVIEKLIVLITVLDSLLDPVKNFIQNDFKIIVNPQKRNK